MTTTGIIPTVGRPDMLRRCLDSLAGQTRRLDELIVVHCGPDDGTRAVVEAQPRAAGRCRYVPYPERNAAAQRNLAVSESTGDVLVFLDDDVELERDWVEQMLAPLEAAREVGATMGEIVNQQLAVPTWFGRLYRWSAGGSRALESGRLIGAAIPNGFPPGLLTPYPAEWIGAGRAAVRRVAFDSVGGFAPYFGGASPGEDLDLGYRLSRHWRVLFVPAARAVHHVAATGRSAPAEYQYQSMRSRFAIMLCAFGWSRPRVYAQLLLWLLFQAVSETAALRRGMNTALISVWAGRLRGFTSCVGWNPPAARVVEQLLPRSAA